MAEYEEQERDAQLAAMDVSSMTNLRFTCLSRIQPSNPLSPLTLSPENDVGEPNPFELQFADEPYVESSMEEEEESESDSDFDPGYVQGNNFAILDSSLPGYTVSENSSPHHLAVYANAKSRPPAIKEKKPHRARWHFGIRSRSPPMEVMAEIYRTLQTLGMEWKEKKELGGLGGLNPKNPKYNNERPKFERIREWDGSDSRHRVDLKAAAGVYLVECRIRLDQIVVSTHSLSTENLHELSILGPHEHSIVSSGRDKLFGRFPS